jgi:23S rRNA (uridine2552-2'-O)-methyltransferase
MHRPFEPQDHYFHQAKKDGYIARSAYKLQEIDEKFRLFGKSTKNILDI